MNDSHLRRIDQCCDQFEQRWVAGECPDIAEFLVDWEGEHRRDVYRHLLELDLD